MTDKPFDPKKPCVRRGNGARIVQLVELARPAEYGEVLFALDETGKHSFHHLNGRCFHTSENPADLLNVPEKVTVQAWGLVDSVSGNLTWLGFSEPTLRHPLSIVVPLTGEYER